MANGDDKLPNRDPVDVEKLLREAAERAPRIPIPARKLLGCWIAMLPVAWVAGVFLFLDLAGHFVPRAGVTQVLVAYGISALVVFIPLFLL
ncbi:MAG: hypothetical protein RDV41_01935, partial [Planctomycetota bacterium]|nr:hypothetical protein [Planctomycetota bacterium]